MTLEQFKTLLASTGMQVAYQYFANPPAMPFITYNQPTTNNFIADGVVYKEIKHMYVTLWTKKRDETSEALLKNVFLNNGIKWQRNENYLDEEKCYEITYEVEV